MPRWDARRRSCELPGVSAEACDGAWSAVSRGTLVTLGQRVAVRLALAQVGEVAKAVVQAAYEIGGGTSIYDHCPLQRCFRDVHKASWHA
jgi:alkylation response protein AidB-like acyl-CoA dehydrogenase